MNRLYILVASVALIASLSGCSGDGAPLLKSGGMADRVGNFSTVKLAKRNKSDEIGSGGITPLKRRLADGSGPDDDEGYIYGTADAQGDNASYGDGNQESGKKKHRHRHRNKNGGNPLFEDSQTYEGEGRTYQGNGAYQGGGPDDQGRGYDRIKLPESIPGGTAGNALDYSQALDAQSRQAQNVPIIIAARVFRRLPDDRRGSPHERFLIKLPNGTTVLIAHNINLAPYVPLAEGDLVTISGEFVWNQKGGVIHYTHRPTNVRHKGGYIDFNGKRYW